MTSLIPIENIHSRILLIRGQKIIIDADLAQLYGVTTKRLNQQVKRNKARFPAEFVIRLTDQEKAEVVTNCNHLKDLKYSPTLPHAFTEHGALMVFSVLNTPIAIRTGIFIVKAFVKLREFLASHQEIAYSVQELEARIESHDRHIRSLWDAIDELSNLPEEKFPLVEGFKKAPSKVKKRVSG